jgi:N-acetylglucosaminyl-diphospho-decaprenol L-rhamnosyltransferase
MRGSPVSISVIIPTRDTRALTLRCLAALDASVSPALEVLLVDEASGDGTADAVRAAFPHVRLISRAVAGGFTAAINAAWPLASGEIVLLLNSDTEVRADALGEVAAAFARDRRLGVAGASLHYPDGRAQWSAGREPTTLWLFVMASGLATTLGRVPGWRRIRRESQAHAHGSDDAFARSRADDDDRIGTEGGPQRGQRLAPDAAWVPGTAMAVRREVRDAIGLFDAEFVTYAQDLDYCLRARAAGWRVAQLMAVHVLHVGGATIGAGPGAVAARQDPRALFADLARWIDKTPHATPARRARHALAIGCRLRVTIRQLARWFVPHAHRVNWDRETASYRDALALVTRPRATR